MAPSRIRGSRVIGLESETRNNTPETTCRPLCADQFEPMAWPRLQGIRPHRGLQGLGGMGGQCGAVVAPGCRRYGVQLAGKRKPAGAGWVGLGWVSCYRSIEKLG